MTTSGTVARTTIDTASIIEHAFRRCKVLPSAQTPETNLIAKECLYMLLLNLGNRGLNLWAVEKAFIGLTQGQATYTTEPGTLDVLNVVYSQPTLASVTFAGSVADAGSPVSGVRLGIKVAAQYTGTLSLLTSSDGLSYDTDSTVSSSTYTPGQYYWFDLSVVSSKQYYSVSGATLADLVVSVSQYDLPMTQWNRDTYSAINAKFQQSRPSTSYFFEKKLTPTLTIWPVPTNNTDHLMIYRHRQPQDVGSLTDQLELPQRWLDGFIWLLASRLCFELPNVDTNITQAVNQMAQQQVFEAELNETDGAPIFLSPSIGVYSR